MDLLFVPLGFQWVFNVFMDLAALFYLVSFMTIWLGWLMFFCGLRTLLDSLFQRLSLTCFHLKQGVAVHRFRKSDRYFKLLFMTSTASTGEKSHWEVYLVLSRTNPW